VFYGPLCTASGYRVADVGDLDGSGMNDIAVGVLHDYLDHPERGALSIYLDVTSGTWDLTEDDDVTIISDTTAANFPHALIGDRDVNGDGLPDIVAGAVGSPPLVDDCCHASSAYIFQSPFVTSFTGRRTYDARLDADDPDVYAGADVAWAGDLDEDGFEDVLIGSFGKYTEDTGAAWFVPGPFSGVMSLDDSAMFKFEGSGVKDMLGGRVAAGELDGDSLRDLVFAATYADTYGTDAGLVQILFTAE